MPSNHPPRVRKIKKYANRRFYDSTDSRHLTLADLHDLVCGGEELLITDSKTGDDITNVILTQILLDFHAPKLAIFPSAILHQLIRTQREFLGGAVQQFLRQSMEAQQYVQNEWARLMQRATGFEPPTTPAVPDWQKWLFPFSPSGASAQTSAETSEDEREDELRDLRAQVIELSRQVDQLRDSAAPRSRSKKRRKS